MAVRAGPDLRYPGQPIVYNKGRLGSSDLTSCGDFDYSRPWAFTSGRTPTPRPMFIISRPMFIRCYIQI